METSVKTKDRGKMLRKLSRAYLVIVLLLIYVPVAVMIRFSFNNSRANVTWQGFTLKYYKLLLRDTSLWKILLTTLLLAAVVTIVSGIIGTLGAVGLRKARFIGKKLITNAIYFPIVIPEIVLAVAMLLLFNFVGMRLSLITVVIGNTTLVLPYVFITVKARLVGMDPSMEEASMDLGADRFYTFLHITTPAILPGIMSGAFMGFSLVLDELIVTSFLADAETVTLPMKVYSMIKKGVSPEINALTTLIFALCLAGFVVYFVYEFFCFMKVRRHG